MHTCFRSFEKASSYNTLKWTCSLLVCKKYRFQNNFSHVSVMSVKQPLKCDTSFTLPLFRKEAYSVSLFFPLATTSRLLPVKFIFGHQFMWKAVRVWSKRHRFKCHLSPETFTITLYVLHAQKKPGLEDGHWSFAYSVARFWTGNTRAQAWAMIQSFRP